MAMVNGYGNSIWTIATITINNYYITGDSLPVDLL